MSGWSFYCLGDPKPQGSMKAFKDRAGNVRVKAANEGTMPWRQALVDATHSKLFPLEGPVNMRVVFTLPRPPSAPKSRIFPAKKPDLDKLIRAVLDSIKTAGGWTDDAQVVGFSWLAKVYVGDSDGLPVPGVVVAAAEVGTRMGASSAVHAALETFYWEAQGDALSRWAPKNSAENQALPIGGAE